MGSYKGILDNHDIDWHFPNTERHVRFGLKDRCLAWSANHETATMHINSEIHPKAVIVWFQMLQEDATEFIEIYKLASDGRWKLVETSMGRIKYRNHNPFQPDSSNAAKNVCLSVFPQNQRKNKDAWLKHLHDEVFRE